jgi:hypothetical protein
MHPRLLAANQIFARTVIVLFLIAIPSGFARGAQDDASKPGPSVPRAPEPSKPPAASGAADVKPAAKTVYTNDSLPSSDSGFAGASLDQINNCDRNCFEQVRRMTRVASDSPSWRRDLLRGIDAVRKDAKWQQALRDLAAAHLSPQRGEDPGAEIRVADPANVTPGELTIDEKYDGKFKEAQTSLQTVYDRQRNVQ